MMGAMQSFTRDVAILLPLVLDTGKVATWDMDQIERRWPPPDHFKGVQSECYEIIPFVLR